jgi:flagellar assembly factor FliW
VQEPWQRRATEAQNVMQITTTRFGIVDIDPDDVLLFSNGVFAFESQRHWVLLADADNGAVAWLQSVTDPAVALPLVSPRRFFPGYQVRIARNQLTTLELAAMDKAFVLTVVSNNDGRLTANLKAPVIINLDRRFGRQVVTSDDQPLQMELPIVTAPPLRRTA